MTNNNLNSISKGSSLREGEEDSGEDFFIKKILVIQQKMIGDVLTTSVLLETLRERFPKASLHFLVNDYTLPVLEHNPNIDRLVVMTAEIEGSVKKFYSFLQQIKKEEYDVIIDVYGKLGSTLITKFSGAAIRIGYHKKHKAFLYTHTIKRQKETQHESSLALENRFRLLKPLGVDFAKHSPKIYLTPEEISSAEKFLKDSGIDLRRPFFMISVLGSGPQKTYPFEYMAKLLDMIVSEEKDAQLLFNYIPKQQAEAQKIFELTQPETQAHIHFSIFGNSLREFLAITHWCDAIIGNEGGANNMAKALNRPTFSIFAPYLNKHNWFGKSEEPKHMAVHLADYCSFTETDKKAAKKNPTDFYLQLKPSLIREDLKKFLRNLNR